MHSRILSRHHIREVVTHDLEVGRVAEDMIMHALTIKLKIGLLNEALDSHVHHIIKLLVAPPLLIC